MPHTPGPWSRNIKPARRYPIIFAGRNTHVCQVISQQSGDAETEANCDLIAAAPDLLAACKAALHDKAELYGKTFDSRMDVDPIVQTLRAAIAAAEGAP
jgi:hypothetical protein